MKRRKLFKVLTAQVVFLSVFFCAEILAGPFSPQASVSGSDAVPLNSPSILGWASGYEGYLSAGSGGCERGTDLSSTFETPEKALGPAGNSNGSNEGTTFDIVSLGRGGCITLTFDLPIADEDGADFAIFENGFFTPSPVFGFLELAWVEVSSDGINFFRFSATSLTASPVSAFSNSVDASNIDGLAGKYIAGFGTPFDLSDLAGHTLLNKQQITHVRIIDIIGDGNTFDNQSPVNPIYDPYATSLSAGFDLDAVAVMHFADPIVEQNVPVPIIFNFILASLLTFSMMLRRRKINTSCIN